MDGSAKPGAGQGRRGLRRLAVVFSVLLGAILIFHRPLLLSVGRAVALHYAAKANLKVDFRAEGTVFTGLTIRNLHVVPTGPTTVESIDIDSVRLDYSLGALIRRGVSNFVENIEVRSARIVLNTDKTPVEPKIPKLDERITLPTIFPERLRLSDVSLTVRTTPHDLVLEHIYLDLLPNKSGELRIAKLQIPSGNAWMNVATQTSYTGKNLVVRGLALDNKTQIRLLDLDASHIDEKKLEVVIDASLAEGTLAGSVGLSQTTTSVETKMRLVAQSISGDELSVYAGKTPGTLGGQIERIAIEGSGVIDRPRSWNGTLTAQLANLHEGKFAVDSCVARVVVQGGKATVDTAELVRGANRIRVAGSADLPEQIRQFGRVPARFDLTADLPELGSLTAGLPQSIAGAAAVNGRVEISGSTLRGDFNLSGSNLVSAGTRAGKITGRLTFSKQMPPTNVTKLYYRDLQSRSHLEISDVQSADYLLDAVHADVASVNERVTLEGLSAERKQNSVLVRGDYRLPDELQDVAKQPATLDLSVRASELADYWIAGSPNKITGPLEASGQIRFEQGLADGQLSLYGRNLTARTLAVPQINAQCAIVKSVVYLNDLSVQLNKSDFLAANAVVDLRPPYQYSGKLLARVADLSALKPLLKASGNDSELAGAVTVDWQGNGNFTNFKNTGQLKLKLERGRYADARALQANVDASYTPGGLDIPIIFLASDKMDFQAIVQAKGSTLEVSKIQIDQGTAKYAAGYISVPFVWSNLGSERPLFPADGKVVATFQSENLDLKRLFEDLGAKPAVSGTMNVKLDAQGTLENLQARVDLQMRDLRSEQFKNFEPASFDLTLQTQNNQLALTGKLQQARIQPLQLQANMPLNVGQILHDRKFDEKTPITAKMQLPRSSVNFVRQFVPALNELDGDLALDVNINGTVAKPVFSGTGDMTVNVARFSNATLPALRGFKTRLVFAQDTLTFERFGGDLAGGPFTVGGRVTFPKLTEPVLDFQLKANSVLVARNDSLTARADADVRVTGPLATASVTGNVALRDSSLLKNIDLIPIGLPGRPAPQPSSSDRPDLSFPAPPLRDWKFDVAVKTKDPFLVRGNLANGGAIVDLHLTGTGLHPGLQGVVRLEKVEATLPFSRLEIAYGFLYFDPGDSFNPKIDLHGTSLIRDYTVHVYVYGSSLAPEAVFTSEPPLPQEEIISLLATGTTREELTGNNNVLAGRAAMLLVQQLYRKVFKKGAATKSNSVFNRLQVDVGNVDPRTGQQSATARYKINEQFVVIGDIGVGGDFRGLVKYLIRFR
ncbi:MAG: translocation/assembly module TamB domain-containing protein [Chthoniobacterales bacterium]